MRLEVEEIRQPLFTPEQIGNGKNARGQHADL